VALVKLLLLLLHLKVRTDISDQRSQETVNSIKVAGGQALAVKCDVSQTKDVKDCLGQVIETFGRLDFAFNNAGVEQRLALIANFEVKEWDRVVDTAMRGIYFCSTQHLYNL
jgi:NAD(P)-dependent dehydrogenase (short-subunit alcohol dehydrogenase family)